MSESTTTPEISIDSHIETAIRSILSQSVGNNTYKPTCLDDSPIGVEVINPFASYQRDSWKSRDELVERGVQITKAKITQALRSNKTVILTPYSVNDNINGVPSALEIKYDRYSGIITKYRTPKHQPFENPVEN